MEEEGWDGKSRGTVLGYKIFIFFIKNVGVQSAYVVLFFVAFYYFLVENKNNRNVYYYFKKRLGYRNLKSFTSIYWSYFKFGQTLIDKTAISLGLRNIFTYEFDGVGHIKNMLANKKGGILISAHIGNFEIANYFFDEIDNHSQINLVTSDEEHENIKGYLEEITHKSKVKLIIVKEDLSHIFEINHALSKGEMVCFTGDRFVPGTQTFEEQLLGKKAKFPAGPFILASRLKAPVLFVYVMKENNKHYHLYARKSKAGYRDAKKLLQEYTGSLEAMLKKYPFQWFNYFDFWDRKNT